MSADETGHGWTDPIGDIARALHTARLTAIEEACERMLTDPRGWGVLVIGSPTALMIVDNNLTRMGWVGLSPDVPFGEIHYRDKV